MPDLDYRVDGVRPHRAGEPGLLFRLDITEPGSSGGSPTPIHSILLRCQVRIEPGRRRYSPGEQSQLLDLFGTPDRWGETVRSLPWANLTVNVPAFRGETAVDLAVPLDQDMTRAPTRYLNALETGEAPLIFLFSGTVFYERIGTGLQVAPIPWDREARYRLPVAIWKPLTPEPAAP